MGNLIALPGPETVQHIFFPGLGLEFDLNRVVGWCRMSSG